ncbi:MAG: hypothetical protein GY930_00100 [bacterium]|nr:hypothetical protein [bacterium]
MRYSIISAALLSLGLAASNALPVASAATEPGFRQRSSRGSQKKPRETGTTQRAERRTTSPSDGKDNRFIPPVDAVDDGQLQVWFENCDHDANGWIGYYEANYALDFGRGLFLSFDKDQDGRLVKDEFVAYYKHASKRGQFRRPKIYVKPRPPERTPLQLMLAYDADLDSGISLEEATRMIADYSRAPLDAPSLFSRVDFDQNQRLDARELQGLSQAIKHLNLATSERPSTQENSRKGLDELFLKIIPSSNRLTPSTLVGPITTFRRLDLDGDGKISLKDLEGLKRTISTRIRVSTVLHLLDSDRDGVLSRLELRQSMERAPRPE